MFYYVVTELRYDVNNVYVVTEPRYDVNNVYVVTEPWSDINNVCCHRAMVTCQQ